MDITFKDVNFTYQPNTPFTHQAIKDLSLSISSGSFVAIIGHTGSGKSTLIRHLNGLEIPTSGEVDIGDFHLAKDKKIKNMKELRSKVGVVFQYPEHQLFEETVEKDIAFGPKNFGVPEADITKRVKTIMPKVGLSNELLEQSPFELSGGQMRRVAIAGVLAIQPEVLVLDEPTAGLDPRGQKEMMDMFYRMHQEENLTTVLVTHSMEDALRYADNVIILNNGTVYMEGAPEEVFVHEKALKDVQLDVPEVIQFLHTFEDRFGVSIPYNRQSTSELAEAIHDVLKGDDRL